MLFTCVLFYFRRDINEWMIIKLCSLVVTHPEPLDAVWKSDSQTNTAFSSCEDASGPVAAPRKRYCPSEVQSTKAANTQIYI